MDREDRRRYFVVGSVIIEVVTPILQQRIKDDQTFRAFGTLQDYLNNPQIKHILFHLRYKNYGCCNDSKKCIKSGPLPMNYNQWDMLYSKTPGSCGNNCHCKYTAKPVQLVDLDISLSCIILLNCCNLTPNENDAIHNVRQLRNTFLGHNTKCTITADEYKSVWPDLTGYVLQLDNTKEDNLIRIENRPLDEALCHKYNSILLDIHETLDEFTTIEVKKAEIKARLITRTYTLQSDREKFTRGRESDKCLLCETSREDTHHFLITCTALKMERDKHLSVLKSYLKNNTPVGTFDRVEEQGLLVLFILNPSATKFKELFKLKKSNYKDIEAITRTLCQVTVFI